MCVNFVSYPPDQSGLATITDSFAQKYLRRAVLEGRYTRADGACICPKCFKEYRRHLAYTESPAFVLLCGGEVVKL